MLMHPSTSSMFSEYGWESDTLGVRYRSGCKLFYHDGVPAELFGAFDMAEKDPDQSVGKFFHANIKKQYPGREIKEAPEMPVAPLPEEGAHA